MHTAEYLSRMRDGAMTPEDVAQLELPWSRGMVDGFRLMVGGTIAGRADRVRRWKSTEVRSQKHFCRFRLCESCHIGGGLHHAFPNHGEGFCPFNDVAVAVRVLQAQRHRARGDRRSRRSPRQRHGVHLRSRSARLHLLDAPAAQLSDVEAARVARHRAARRRARRHVPPASSNGALPRGDGAAARSVCSISPAPIRTKTISSAGCG